MSSVVSEKFLTTISFKNVLNVRLLLFPFRTPPHVVLHASWRDWEVGVDYTARMCKFNLCLNWLVSNPETGVVYSNMLGIAGPLRGSFL